MNDRAVIGAGTVGDVLAVICCAAPLLAVGLPLAGLGAWLADAGRVLLPLVVSGIALVAWGLHHRLAKAEGYEWKIHKEGGKS
jgi:mercuric ion transport protein